MLFGFNIQCSLREFSQRLWRDQSQYSIRITLFSHLSVVDVGVELEVPVGVAEAEVVLHQLGLGGVEGGLVA